MLLFWNNLLPNPRPPKNEPPHAYQYGAPKAAAHRTGASKRFHVRYPKRGAPLTRHISDLPRNVVPTAACSQSYDDDEHRPIRQVLRSGAVHSWRVEKFQRAVITRHCHPGPKGGEVGGGGPSSCQTTLAASKWHREAGAIRPREAGELRSLDFAFRQRDGGREIAGASQPAVEQNICLFVFFSCSRWLCFCRSFRSSVYVVRSSRPLHLRRGVLETVLFWYSTS